jgi:undecaprenol kinase/diacylglycerol kinase (ATP)
MIQNNSAAIYRQTLIKTFTNAFNGLKYFFKTERNGKIQAAVSIVTVIAGLYLHLSAFEWIITFLCISMVLALEMLNSGLEYLCNLVHGEYHPLIKIIKDVAAGAVLFASIISLIIGLIIFLPKIFY